MEPDAGYAHGEPAAQGHAGQMLRLIRPLLQLMCDRVLKPSDDPVFCTT